MDTKTDRYTQEDATEHITSSTNVERLLHWGMVHELISKDVEPFILKLIKQNQSLTD